MPLSLATLCIGFTIVLAPVLALAWWRTAAALGHGWRARAWGIAALACFVAAQLWHAGFLQRGWPLDRRYAVLLSVQAACFFGFFLATLRPPEHVARRGEWLLVASSIVATLALPARYGIPLSFACGCVYAVLLLRQLGQLRARSRFLLVERSAMAGFGVAALVVALAGLGAPWLDWQAYVQVYAVLIGLGFAGVLYLLLCHPDLPARLVEAVQASYAQSTLAKVDRAAAMQKLRTLLEQDRVYQDENLSLSGLAGLMELGSHQLSELINSECGHGFSRLLRQHRVAAAQRMLLDEPEASVLSVGLAVGFNAQSNFYAAFKELTGENPGQFRKRHRQQDGAGPG